MNNWELATTILEVYSEPKTTEMAVEDDRLSGYDHELVKSTIRALRRVGLIRDITGERRTLLSVSNKDALTDEALEKIAKLIDGPKRPSPPLFGE